MQILSNVAYNPDQHLISGVSNDLKKPTRLETEPDEYQDIDLRKRRPDIVLENTEERKKESNIALNF